MNARLLAVILAALAGLRVPPAGGVARAEADTPPLPASTVELSENAEAATLSNGAVTLTFSKTKGVLKSLLYGGKELLASGGGYIQIAFASRKDAPPVKWEWRVVRRETGFVEVAFANTDPRCPFDFAAHYILRAGDPGFYNYLVYGHDAARSPGVQHLAQYNYCMRVAPALFTVAAVDHERIKPFPKREALTPDRMVMDATYRLPEGGFYSKYFFSAEMDEQHTAHGAMGNGIGIWILMPSHEHLNGGPEHQELTVHQTDSSPVLLCHATAAHYGAGVLTSDSKDGSWSKVSAPWFVYVNCGKDQAGLWQDAKTRAEKEVRQWPSPWLDETRFQLSRGSVTGRLAFGDRTPAAGARVILAAHEEKPSPHFWQQQWRGYRFYSWTDKDGGFAIAKVRPGLYDLYAWKPGIFGQFVKRGIRVDAGVAANAGELVWDQPREREVLWQIGVPDRSAHEFGYAEDFRQWGLWDTIAAATPEGVAFVAGKSKDRGWPFEMAVTQNPDLSWRAPVWRVQFDSPAPRTGKAVLTLGIAAYEGRQKPQIKVSVNGQEVGAVQDLEESGAAHRSGIHGAYQEREIVFDAAKLKLGANELTLELPSPGRKAEKLLGNPASAVLWDCLRLDAEAAPKP